MVKKPILIFWAELIDAWRVVPRIVLFSYGLLVYYVVSWYMDLIDPTTQQTILVTTITSLSSAIIGLYHNSSKNWIEYNKETTENYLKLKKTSQYIEIQRILLQMKSKKDVTDEAVDNVLQQLEESRDRSYRTNFNNDSHNDYDWFLYLKKSLSSNSGYFSKISAVVSTLTASLP